MFLYKDAGERIVFSDVQQTPSALLAAQNGRIVVRTLQ